MAQTIRVFNQEHLDGIVAEAEAAKEQEHITRQTTAQSSLGLATKTYRERRAALAAQLEEQKKNDKKLLLEQQQQAAVARLRAKFAKEEAARIAQFEENYDSLLHERDTFVAKMDGMLANAEQSYHQKLHTMHTQWRMLIFDKIQAKVDKDLEKLTDKDIINKHKRASEAFLEACRKKQGALFLDVVMEDDYNPTAEINPIKYCVNDDNDPTLNGVVKFRRDNAAALSPRGQRKVINRKDSDDTGRPDLLPVQDWTRVEKYNKHAEKMGAGFHNRFGDGPVPKSLHKPIQDHYYQMPVLQALNETTQELRRSFHAGAGVFKTNPAANRKYQNAQIAAAAEAAEAVAKARQMRKAAGARAHTVGAGMSRRVRLPPAGKQNGGGGGSGMVTPRKISTAAGRTRGGLR